MIEFLGLQTITIGFVVKFILKRSWFIFCSSSKSKISIFGGTGGILGVHLRVFENEITAIGFVLKFYSRMMVYFFVLAQS